MVFYIRFLKPPIATVPPNGGPSHVKTVLTITTDLGDTFYNSRAVLQVRLASYSLGPRKVICEKSVTWLPGNRALSVDLKISPEHRILDVSISCPSLGEHEIATEQMPELLSATSDAFPLVRQCDTQRMTRRAFPFSDLPDLDIWEETGESIARHIWDAGLGLVAYIRNCCEKPDPSAAFSLLAQLGLTNRQKKLNIVELGSGCGIVGIFVGQIMSNCHILLTDLPEAMPILDFNMQHAKLMGGSVLQKSVLNWDEELPKLVYDRQTDLILISDCTYNVDSLPALVKTLSALLRHSMQAQVVVSMKVRHFSEAVFFELMNEAGIKQMKHSTIVLPQQSRLEAGQDLEQIEIYEFGLGDKVL